MKITRAISYHLSAPLTRRYGDSKGLKSARTTFVVRVDTDDGVTGWGEILPYGLTPRMVEEALSQCLGQDPLDTFGLSERLRRTSPRIAGGLEIALWDIKGKVAGLPIVNLLGGARRDEQPAYASLQNYFDTEEPSRAVIDEVNRALSLGFTSIKIKIGGYAIKSDLAWLEDLAQELPKHIPVAIDANQAYDLQTAVGVANHITELHPIAWFEEPLATKHVARYQELRQRTDVHISGAESFDNARVAEAITENAMDIVNPDIVLHGGFFQMQRLQALCDQHEVELIPHVFDGQLIRVATLHFLAAQPNYSFRH
jgi:D-galactarolactone cycloisomerase